MAPSTVLTVLPLLILVAIFKFLFSNLICSVDSIFNISAFLNTLIKSQEMLKNSKWCSNLPSNYFQQECNTFDRTFRKSTYMSCVAKMASFPCELT